MTRSATLLLALAVAVGCGKKKPADPPAPVVPTPVTPQPDGQPGTPSPPTGTEVAKHLKAMKVHRAEVQQPAAAALAALAESDPAVIPALVELLADKSGLPVGKGTAAGPNSVREAAVLALVLAGPTGEKAAVEKALPVLLAALGDENEAVRLNAVSAIGRIGPKASSATSTLLPLTSHPTVQVREAAFRALVEIGGTSAGPVCKLLTHADEGVRVTAAENLNDFRPIPPEAVDDLTVAVADDNATVRLVAAQALGELGAKAAPAVPALLKALAARTAPDKLDLDAFAFAALSAVVAVGEPAVPAVVKHLTDKAPVMRFLAAYALGEIGPPAKSAAEPLEKLFNTDPFGEIQAEAARALVVVTGSIDKVKGPVEAALKDKRADNRRGVLQLIGRMGPAGKPFAPAALALLDDADATVRAAALEYVATLDPDTAKPAVAGVAKLLSDDDSETRQRAAKVLLALGKGAAPALPVLVKAIATDAEERVRLTALDALAGVGPLAKSTVPELSKVIADASSPTAVRLRALAVAPVLDPADTELAKAVVKALFDKAEDIRGAACLTVPRLADPPADAVTKLGDLIASEKTFAGRTKAVRAAAQLGPKAAKLKDKLVKAAASEVRDHAFWAKAALASVEGKPGEAESLMRAALSSRLPVERNAALTAFAGWLTPKAGDAVAVTTASKDRSAAVRRAAVAVLVRVPNSPVAVTRLAELLKDADADVKQDTIAGLEKLGPSARLATSALRAAASGKDDTARAARKALRAVAGE